MSNKTRDDGGAAFPRIPTIHTDGATGMSLRDSFAASYVRGVSQSFEAHKAIVREGLDGQRLDLTTYYAEITAETAYKVADAMLAARKAGA